MGASVLKHQISWKYGVCGSSGGSNPPLEVQIYLWRSNPAQGAQIELLGTQIQLWRLKSSPGDSNPALTCQKGQPAARGKSHGASDLKCAAWGKPHHQSPEQLKMSFQMHSGSHLATRAQNSSKSASKGHLRATWPPEPRTALPVLALVAQWLPS